MTVVNNVVCISPNGEKYYSTLHWVKQFLNAFNGAYREVESEVFGLFDGFSKGKHKVMQFQDKPLPETTLKGFEVSLNKGEEVKLFGWSFHIEA